MRILCLILVACVGCHKDPTPLPLEDTDTVEDPVPVEEPTPLEDSGMVEPACSFYDKICYNIVGFDLMVSRAAERYDVDPDVLVAIIYKESGCRPSVIGDGGAAYGLGQIHPRWWRKDLQKEGIIKDDKDLFIPEQAVMAVAYIISKLTKPQRPLFDTIRRYNGSGPAARKYAGDVLIKVGRIRQKREAHCR